MLIHFPYMKIQSVSNTVSRHQGLPKSPVSGSPISPMDLLVEDMPWGSADLEDVVGECRLNDETTTRPSPRRSSSRKRISSRDRERISRGKIGVQEGSEKTKERTRERKSDDSSRRRSSSGKHPQRRRSSKLSKEEEKQEVPRPLSRKVHDVSFRSISTDDLASLPASTRPKTRASSMGKLHLKPIPRLDDDTPHFASPRSSRSLKAKAREEKTNTQHLEPEKPKKAGGSPQGKRGRSPGALNRLFTRNIEDDSTSLIRANAPVSSRRGRSPGAINRLLNLKKEYNEASEDKSTASKSTVRSRSRGFLQRLRGEESDGPGYKDIGESTCTGDEDKSEVLSSSFTPLRAPSSKLLSEDDNHSEPKQSLSLDIDVTPSLSTKSSPSCKLSSGTMRCMQLQLEHKTAYDLVIKDDFWGGDDLFSLDDHGHDSASSDQINSSSWHQLASASKSILPPPVSSSHRTLRRNEVINEFNGDVSRSLLDISSRSAPTISTGGRARPTSSHHKSKSSSLGKLHVKGVGRPSSPGTLRRNKVGHKSKGDESCSSVSSIARSTSCPHELQSPEKANPGSSSGAWSKVNASFLNISPGTLSKKKFQWKNQIALS